MPEKKFTLEQMKAMMDAHVKAGEEFLSKPHDEKYRPSQEYWDLAMPTFLENWPSALHNLSIGSVRRKLTLNEAHTLGSYILELGEGFNRPENAEAIKNDLIDRLHDPIRYFPSGAFIRLGSRSPKDTFWDEPPNGKIVSGQQAFDLLTTCSERICDDLHMQIAMAYEPSVWIREGLDIPEWSEFRCFMQERKLIGISQYYYHKVHPEIVEDAAGIKWAIEQFFEHQFRDASHLESVVFDVFVKRRGLTSWQMNGQNAGKRFRYEIELLEINPFFTLCDPCLFDWNKLEEFRGQLRFRSELGGHRTGITDCR